MKNQKFLIISILSTLIISGCSKENISTSANSPEKNSTVIEKQSGPELFKHDQYYFDGKTAETEDVKIEITDQKIIRPGEVGNEYGEKPVIAFWFKVTNKTGKDFTAGDAWIALFSCIQDNDPNMINNLNVGNLPDDRYLDTQFNSIKNGGTVEDAIAYELSDLETPVTLICTKGYDGQELGKFDYQVK